MVDDIAPRRGRGPYDRCVPSADAPLPRARPPLPNGLAVSRRLVRRRGGFVAVAVVAGLVAVGNIGGWIIGGSLGGIVAFVSLVMALPVMPILGMPAAGGTGRFLLALAVSALVWWFVGQSVAGRVTRRPVAGWREWSREFVIVGSGLWLGALGALALAALLLGVF